MLRDAYKLLGIEPRTFQLGVQQLHHNTFLPLLIHGTRAMVNLGYG